MLRIFKWLAAVIATVLLAGSAQVHAQTITSRQLVMPSGLHDSMVYDEAGIFSDNSRSLYSARLRKLRDGKVAQMYLLALKSCIVMPSGATATALSSTQRDEVSRASRAFADGVYKSWELAHPAYVPQGANPRSNLVIIIFCYEDGVQGVRKMYIKRHDDIDMSDAKVDALLKLHFGSFDIAPGATPVPDAQFVRLSALRDAIVQVIEANSGRHEVGSSAQVGSTITSVAPLPQSHVPQPAKLQDGDTGMWMGVFLYATLPWVGLLALAVVGGLLFRSFWRMADGVDSGSTSPAVHQDPSLPTHIARVPGAKKRRQEPGSGARSRDANDGMSSTFLGASYGGSHASSQSDPGPSSDSGGLGNSSSWGGSSSITDTSSSGADSGSWSSGGSDGSSGGGGGGDI